MHMAHFPLAPSNQSGASMRKAANGSTLMRARVLNDVDEKAKAVQRVCRQTWLRKTLTGHAILRAAARNFQAPFIVPCNIAARYLQLELGSNFE